MTVEAGFWIWLIGAPAAIIFTAYLIYAPLTDLWCRYFDSTIVKHGPDRGRQIALTFDDGPNPEYTPRFLAALADRNVPAAFFLVGERAERYQDIVRQIEAGHHLIGTHTYSHRHAYLMTPWRARQEVVDGLAALADKTGQPAWFRPPWGAFNLATRLTAGSKDQRIAMWSVTGEDWKKNRTAEDIVATVTGQLAPGAVVVLHDSGGATGAAERTLAALPHIIEWAINREYQWVRLDQLAAFSPGQKKAAR